MPDRSGRTGLLWWRRGGGETFVNAGGAFGFIDKAGEIAIPLRFAGAHEFSDGLAPVRLGGA